jgi:hypothetical protein
VCGTDWVFKFNCCLYRSAMCQAVSVVFHNAGSRICSQASSCEIFGGQKWHRVLLCECFTFSLSFSLDSCFMLMFTLVVLLSEETSEAWESSSKECSSGSRTALDRKLFLPF